jgi:hypothetical protein
MSRRAASAEVAGRELRQDVSADVARDLQLNYGGCFRTGTSGQIGNCLKRLSPDPFLNARSTLDESASSDSPENSAATLRQSTPAPDLSFIPSRLVTLTTAIL